MKRTLTTISVAIQLFSSLTVLAQQDFVRHEHVTICIPGKIPGSYIAKRTDDKLFYSATDKKNWHPATTEENPYKGKEWVLAMQNTMYTITPAGSWMRYELPGGFYRSERVGQPRKLISTTPPQFLGEKESLPLLPNGNMTTPWDTLPKPLWQLAEGMSISYKFATEQSGYCYFDYGPWIYTTSDGGATWQLTGNLTRAAGGSGLVAEVNNIHFLNSQLGFGVLHLYKPSAKYMRDNDGATSNFNLGMAEPEDFYETRLLKTTDGGRTWSRVRVAGNFNRQEYHKHTVRFHQAAGQPISFYAYGENRIYESADGGVSFTPRPIKDFSVHWNQKVTVQQQCYVDSVHFAPFQVWFFNLGVPTIKSREAGY